MHLSKKEKWKFSEAEDGLYLLSEKITKNTSDKGNDKDSDDSKNTVTNYSHSFLSVDDLSSASKSYTKKEIKQAVAAITLFRSIGMPSFSLFIKLLESNYFRNCPVTPEDAKRASKI